MQIGAPPVELEKENEHHGVPQSYSIATPPVSDDAHSKANVNVALLAASDIDASTSSLRADATPFTPQSVASCGYAPYDVRASFMSQPQPYHQEYEIKHGDSQEPHTYAADRGEEEGPWMVQHFRGKKHRNVRATVPRPPTMALARASSDFVLECPPRRDMDDEQDEEEEKPTLSPTASAATRHAPPEHVMPPSMGTPVNGGGGPGTSCQKDVVGLDLGFTPPRQFRKVARSSLPTYLRGQTVQMGALPSPSSMWRLPMAPFMLKPKSKPVFQDVTRMFSTVSFPGQQKIGQRPERPIPDHTIAILTRGLMGSGKSTTMQMLSYLLGGSVINQDDFHMHGSKARIKFTEAIKELGQEKGWIFCDKINTMESHRKGIKDAVGNKNAKFIILDFVHPDDGPESYENSIALCKERINIRKGSHRTLFPGPHIDGILSRTATDRQPLNKHEEKTFKLIPIDMTLPPIGMAQMCMLLIGLEYPELEIPEFSDKDYKDAFEFVKRREEKINKEMGESYQDHRIKSVGYWGISFDEESRKILHNLFQETAHTKHTKLNAEQLHTTLLYIGGEDLGGDAQRKKMFDQLEAMTDKRVQIWLTALAYDNRLVTASVWLPNSIPCDNKFPHVTLAKIPEARAVESNDLLQRVADGEAMYYKLRPVLLTGVIKPTPCYGQRRHSGKGTTLSGQGPGQKGGGQKGGERD